MLNINKESLERVVDVLSRSTGEQMQTGMDTLARLVKENDGNAIMEQFTEECKKMQASYNDHYVPAVTGIWRELETMEEFADLIKRASSKVTEAKIGDTDIEIAEVELPDL